MNRTRDCFDAVMTGVITGALDCKQEDIQEVVALKKGMTNHSYCFSVKGKKYIIRIPGEGTSKLINRYQEADVYAAIAPYDICEAPVYLNAENGIKITRFIENVRACDPDKQEDVLLCIQKLKKFHELNLKVSHSFDLFGMLDYYEQLRQGPSCYSDYEAVKKDVISLGDFIESNVQNRCLCHIDSVYDNFLFDDSREDDLHLQLTDWEYAGMQDPHLDIAMFSVYAGYNKEKIDKLIEMYFEGECPIEIRAKIYAYISVCGLLWSNWCEYKHQFGLDFGKYALAQYAYAKEYYLFAKEIIEQCAN